MREFLSETNNFFSTVIQQFHQTIRNPRSDQYVPVRDFPSLLSDFRSQQLRPHIGQGKKSEEIAPAGLWIPDGETVGLLQ